MPRLVLVRHAQPRVDPALPSRLWTLSAEGRERCGELARRLGSLGLARIVTSMDPKAIETGTLVASSLRLPVASAPDLHEHEREGQPFLAPDAFEEAMRAFFARPRELVFGSESAAAALTRFRTALESVLGEFPRESLAVVAHGAVISLFVEAAPGWGGFELWRRLGLPSFILLGLPGYELVETVTEV